MFFSVYPSTGTQRIKKAGQNQVVWEMSVTHNSVPANFTSVAYKSVVPSSR